MVCYKSNAYIDRQLKVLYEFNDPESFEALVIENNSEDDKAEMDVILKPYLNKYKNIRSFFFKPESVKKRKEAFIQGLGAILQEDMHGLAIEFGKKMVNTKYLMIQDPDFFWLQNNYLNLLEGYLESGYVAIGAPYPSKIGIGSPDFPAAFGCAYLTEKVKDLSFLGGNHDIDKIKESLKTFPRSKGYCYSLDVGYRVRGRLSSEKYLSFTQDRPVKEKGFNFLSRNIGRYGIAAPKYYFLENKNIGVHMFGGSRLSDQVYGYMYLKKEERDLIDKEWIANRYRYANAFYDLIKMRSSSGLMKIVLKARQAALFSLGRYTYKKRDKKLLKDLVSLTEGDVKWTIGMVNYKTLPYLHYQLRILYELNDPKEFKLIIVDNSFPTQKKELEEIISPYAAHKNIEIICHTPTYNKELKGSLDHSEGLNIVLQNTDTSYLLVHDPDFFWVQKNYLKTFESYILRGNVTIGAPYITPMKFGRPNFPAAFGCAFSVKSIRQNNLDFDIGKTAKEVGFDHKDVGWKMRERLSMELYKSFEQQIADIKGVFGAHSFDINSREYFLNGKKIAYHLYRGSFVDDEKGHKNAALDKNAPEMWDLVREKYAQFFYLLAKGVSKSKIIKHIK
jgi:hypothetical protein